MEKICLEFFENLYESFSRRIQTVIDVKGDPTNYYDIENNIL